jgi:tetratricopeptide (TPR) repeat protein
MIHIEAKTLRKDTTVRHLYLPRLLATVRPLLLSALLLLASCADLTPSHHQGDKSQAAATPPLAQALAEFNRGAALMEQYKYSGAVTAFETSLRFAPDWIAARFNLGLARFNMHGTRGGQNSLEAARETFQAVLASDPDHLPASFCLGLYHQHLGRTAQALEYFRKVYERDNRDPYVAYKCAETLIGLGRHDEGTRMLERVIELDPGFISAVYRLAIQYSRMKQRDKAKPLFERFKNLHDAELAGGSFTVQKVYGTAGKYYMALGADSLPLERPEPDSIPRVVFSPNVKTLDIPLPGWKWGGGSVNLPGIAAGDLDGDGDLDICLAAGSGKENTTVWLNKGSGKFSAGVPVAGNGISPCFGDVDNDGDLDLWIGSAGSDTLLDNDGKGRFSKVAFSDIGAGNPLTSCARLLDIDSDGDLDLLAFRFKGGSLPAAGDLTPGPSTVYINNRDGSFADAAARLGIVPANTPVAASVYDDFDNDRDIDMVIFPAGKGEPLAWINDRAWKHRILDVAETGIDTRGTVSATSGDPDRDGDRDLLVFTGEGVQLHVNLGGFRFKKDQVFADRCSRLGGTGGQFADIDNDGDIDIVIADAHRRDGSRGPALLINDWPRNRFLNAVEIDPGNLLGAIRTKGDASCVVADFTGNGRCDVLLAPSEERPMLLENVTPGGNWIEFDIRGALSPDKRSRSNKSAIGARVEVKSGSVFQQFVVGAPSGALAMPPLRVHAGLGNNSKVEWLRIMWPDGVLQAELELPANQVMTITELQRKTSSCPVLFAWDGSHFQFVADFGGVGGLGYWVAPDTYAPPDPTEYLRLPNLKPLNGEYVLQVLENLEEVTYLDETKLVAVDHPEGTEVYPHEMMAISVPPPPFEVFCFRDSIEPVSAVNHRGEDVTGRLKRIDRQYAGATDLDPRFTGIAGAHYVELDFGDRLNKLDPKSRLVLFLQGWVEYGYSSTGFAANQARVRAEAPSIHVRRGDQWVELFHEAGYPAGLEHMMTLDVTGKILPGDRLLRISSNMELYWDRIFLAVHLDDSQLSLQEVAAASADLHFLGYPREYSPDGHHPNIYDYANIDTAVAWKLMDGDYTRFGDVAELLERADDCFVIMGRGEEVTLRFPAKIFGPVPAGRTRTFIFKKDSYCKDMDLCTAYADTVEPLPFHSMSAYPYRRNESYPDNEKTREYRRRFNTRRVRTH